VALDANAPVQLQQASAEMRTPPSHGLVVHPLIVAVRFCLWNPWADTEARPFRLSQGSLLEEVMSRANLETRTGISNYVK
jgi:hypothetical protein